MVHLAFTAATLMCPIFFQEFIKTFNKSYSSDVELNIRQTIFCQNYEFIQNHNAKNSHTYTLGVNEHADLSDEEFGRLFTTPIDLNMVESNTYDDTVYTKPLPLSYDWRDKILISVKNQQQCGSCWAFSTTGSIESHVAIYRGENVLLSEQELVDCSWMYANLGCSGGMVDRAFRYVKRFGLSTEEFYPYTAKNHMCKLDTFSSKNNKTFITNWLDIVPFNETRITETLYNRGPISVAIDAGSRAFRFYKSGVFDDCGYTLNHAVLLVGYGTEDGVDYYIIKNSWGKTFGDNGYIKLIRGKYKAGTCGLGMIPSVVVV